MATILKFRSHAKDDREPRGEACVPAEVIVFPRMSLQYLCRIAAATDASRNQAVKPPIGEASKDPLASVRI
jgi:hypothetical protein